MTRLERLQRDFYVWTSETGKIMVRKDSIQDPYVFNSIRSAHKFMYDLA